MKKIVLSVVLVIVVGGLSAAIWWLFSTNRLVLDMNPSTKEATKSEVKLVCDSNTVDIYNAAMFYTTRGESNEYSIDDRGLQDLVGIIKNKDGYEDDATCQTILFWYYARVNNYQYAKSAYDAIVKLHELNIYSDSNLRSDQPLFMYEETLKGLTGSGFSEQDAVNQ